MKRRNLFAAAAFLLATASAFTAPKVFNVTGFAKNSLGQVVSGPTNQSGCALNQETNCTMTVAGVSYSTVDNSAANINNAADILKFN